MGTVVDLLDFRMTQNDQIIRKWPIALMRVYIVVQWAITATGSRKMTKHSLNALAN